MRIDYKKVLGITLAGLMVVAPMVSSANENNMEMTDAVETIEATRATDEEIRQAKKEGTYIIVGEPTDSTEAATVVPAQVGDKNSK